jgi:hypothetical protein
MAGANSVGRGDLASAPEILHDLNGLVSARQPLMNFPGSYVCRVKKRSQQTFAYDLQAFVERLVARMAGGGKRGRRLILLLSAG